MKTSDEELSKWRFEHRRSPISWRIIGDEVYAQAFIGEAKALLFSVKSALQLNKQPQGDGQRNYPDGTIIRVKCVYGIDYITIDTSQSSLKRQLGAESCVITFIDLPAKVPPMKDPYQIKSDDKIGVNYIKTYFRVELFNCPDCLDAVWDLTFKYKIPYEERHWINPDLPEGDPNKEDKNDHTVYSMSPPAWARIVDKGHDKFGGYIIWKAFTESGDELSRTGLGIMLLKATVGSPRNAMLCKNEKKIDVDCCEKPLDLRKAEIWWEDFGTCQPYIMYGGVLYDAICKMPEAIPMGGTRGLIWYACTHPYQPFYAIPEIKGSCLPLKWELSGPISFLGSSKEDDYTIFLKCGEGDCRSGGSITLTDRCGSVYYVRVKPCCEEAAPLEVGYASLGMGCGQQQQFNGVGGCGPYTWSVDFGSIDETGLYTAPSTNPGCQNANVQVTDCCGNSASVAISINCYTDGVAVAEMRWILCDTVEGPPPYEVGLVELCFWDCAGMSLGCACYTAAGLSGPCPFCYSGPCDCDRPTPPGEYVCTWGEKNFQCSNCSAGGFYPCWDIPKDVRTAKMIEEGCCPPPVT